VVTVLDGRVVVQGHARGGEWREELTPHEQMEYSPDGHRVVRVVDPAGATQWEQGVFSSEDADLGRVVSELRRYTRSPIIIADPSLNKVKVVGTVFLHNVPMALRGVVESATGQGVAISLTRSGDQFVLRSTAPASSASSPAASTPHGPHGKGS
jgi:ferric-dicitrate binding protein FerR (iron transport regulator)